MTWEAKEREIRLRGDLEQLRSQQEHALGTLDTRNDAMMERRTQARLDSLMENWSTSTKREAHSREANREPRVNFNDRPNRGRTHGSVRGWGNSTRMAPVTTGRGGVQRIPEEVLLAAGRSRMNEYCERRVRVEEMNPHPGTTRIKEDLSPAIRIEGKRIKTIKRDIRLIQRQ